MGHDSSRERRYVPAMSIHALTGALDPFMKAVGMGDGFRLATAALLGMAPGDTVLDLGAGTGALAVWLKRLNPTATVAGIDPDEGILERARARARAANVDLDLRRAFAQELPFADASFDKAVSTLVFHHLDTEGKRAAAREALRVLKPGGRFLLVDFGPPQHAPALGRLLASLKFEHTADNFAGRLPRILVDAGFERVGTAYSSHWIVRFLVAFRPR